jgi:hypothetical protein
MSETAYLFIHSLKKEIMINWGYTYFGKHTLVKLKVTLTELEKGKLVNSYGHTLNFFKAKRSNSWIIQGCIIGRYFKDDLKSALLQTKISLLQNELETHSEKSLGEYHVVF